MIKNALFLLVLALIASTTSYAQEAYIAGVEPDKRPVQAPTIERMIKGDSWYAHALAGIDQPYPSSLRFLENQGPWFSPFQHPGMTGPYDLRGWHQAR